jgi:uncharacterized membrane protein YhaH (DUF805 family)
MAHSHETDSSGPSARSAAVFTALSLALWAAGAFVLAFAFWQDTKPAAGGHDDVGAGLAGLALLVLLGVFVIATAIGGVLGTLAVRRAPDRNLPLIAQGLNVVTLVGVIMSIAVNFALL